MTCQRCCVKMLFVSQAANQCVVPYSPHRKSLEITRGRGISQAEFIKERYEAKLEFPLGRGGGG